MALPPLKSFAEVQNFFAGINVAGGHGAFWNLSYDQFVGTPTIKNYVPNVTDPNSGQPIPILTKGDGAHSNIIYALSGTKDTLWDPNNPGGFGRMPKGGPYFSAEQIQQLSDWITGPPACPE